MAGTTITFPDGSTQTFAPGMSQDQIQSEADRIWTSRQPAQTPQPQRLTAPGQMPPGLQPGPMNAKSQSLLEQEMVPLSEEAQRAERMITQGGITKNPALERAGAAILARDPTYQARKKQSEGTGEAAGKRNEMRMAGENILGSFAKLYHAWENTPDEVLGRALGARNTAPLKEESPTFIPFTNIPIPGLSGPTTVDPATKTPIAGQITPVQRAAILNPKDKNAIDAWNAYNLFKHGAHGVTNALLTSAPKGMNMSDARQAVFASAMEDFMKAETRADQGRILDHAKTIIQNDFNLTPAEADKVLKHHLTRLGEEAEHDKAIKAAANLPPDAVKMLIESGGARRDIDLFNKNLNGGKPGLAERLLKAHGIAPQ